MPRDMCVVRVSLLAMLAFSPTVPIAAQASASSVPSVDSVLKLNRAGLWDQAAGLARRGIGSSSSTEDKCSFEIAGTDAVVRLGLYAQAADELGTIDQKCGQSAAVRDRAAELKTIRAETVMPPLPKTGMDFSAIDQFWIVADLLAQNKPPSDSQWRAMLTTPGYFLSMMVVETTRSDMEIATLRDSLTRGLPIQDAVRRAAKFLPPHATEGIDPPLVTFAVFRDDAYSLGEAESSSTSTTSRPIHSCRCLVTNSTTHI